MALEKAKDFLEDHSKELLVGTAAGLVVAAVTKVVGPRVVERIREMDLFSDEESGPNVSDPNGNS
jgi:hypothetical protein